MKEVFVVLCTYDDSGADVEVFTSATKALKYAKGLVKDEFYTENDELFTGCSPRQAEIIDGFMMSKTPGYYMDLSDFDCQLKGVFVDKRKVK